MRTILRVRPADCSGHLCVCVSKCLWLELMNTAAFPVPRVVLDFDVCCVGGFVCPTDC